MSFDEEKLLKQFAAEKGVSSRHTSDSANSSINEQAPDEFRTSDSSTKPLVQVNPHAEYWSVKEACAVGGFSHTTFYELRKTHDLPSCRPKGFGRRVVKRVQFLQWLEQRLWVGDRDEHKVG